MKRIGNYGKILIVALVVVACAIIACLSIDFSGEKVIEAGQLRSDYNYGEFTFIREMTLNTGEKAYYYESGDESYSYLHDNRGYILLKDEDKATLEYAVSDQGRPVTSGVSYAEPQKIASSLRMQIGDVDFALEEVQENAKGLDGMSVVETKPVLAGNTSSAKNISNITIFIAFNGDKFSPTTDLLNTFNGTSMSLKSYYQVMSNNTITINSVIPYNSNTVFVYQDAKSRDYYNTNSSNRWTRESTLVTNAIKAATEYITFSNGTNLDVNNDGYIDSVSIIVSGQSSTTWGSLLWPHSVSLDAIDGDNNYTVINGKKVGKYAFNFEENITLGVLCHETAHVLGAPDLYHYYASADQSTDIATVGKWDLMENDLDTPQYLLTYMRKNYIGGIGENQIVDITGNGVYSLSPVSSATSVNDVLAYKIPTSKDEYFMIEYRRVTKSGYDSLLPGSGLIIYRVKEPADFSTSEGNVNGIYKGTGNRADEVFVFRPTIKMKDGQSMKLMYSNSLYDIGYAYLSPNNQYFNKVGKENSTGLYDFSTIFYSDGSNSDIVIEALSISESSIEFSVRLGQDMVEDDYFDDKIALKDVDMVNSTAFAGVTANVEFQDINPQYLSALTIELQDENGDVLVENELNQGRFLLEYNAGARLIKSDFIYADKGNDIPVGVFTSGAFLSDKKPTKAVLKVTDADGDSKVIDELAVQDSANIGWDTIVGSKTELHAQVVASTKMTVGIKRDGTLDASGTSSEGQWAIEGYEGITSVALGYTQTLLLTKNLNVLAVGDDYYGETQVSGWYDIKAISAGTYCSYGLRTDGTVLSVGLNDKGQLNVDAWSGIKAIDAIGKRVVGLTLTGTVVATGNFTADEISALSNITNAKQVEVGLNFVAVLKNDGSVQIVGTLPSADLSAFNGVKKISAGVHHLLGIKEDGTVIATGDNSYGQSMVSELYDIIDIAGGEYHSAFLREDGVVEFRGSGFTKYGTNIGVGNLLYDKYIPVTAINGLTNVSGGVMRVPKGESVTLGGVLYVPTNATYARMIFSSKDISVATITATDYTTAVVYGVSVGKTTATIKDNGTGITTTFTIEVYEEKALEGIAFSESKRSILQGSTAYLTLNYLPEGIDSSKYLPSYSSSDDSIVSVSSMGVIQAKGNVGQKATITAKVGEFSATITISIVGEVSAIAVDLNGGSTLYKYGEDLDLSRYILKVTIGDSVEDMVMTEDMISGYDKYNKTSITQLLTVEYMGVETTFSISVKDYVVSIEKVTDPTKRYLYNYDLDAVSGGYMVYYASGDQSGPNVFSAEHFSGYDKTKVGTQLLTYTYTDAVWGTEFVLTEEVTVVDYAREISFQPVKTAYLYGQALDLSEFVDINMMSGATRQMELAEFEVEDIHSEESNPASELYALYSLRVGSHIIKVSYIDPETDQTHTTTTIITVYISGEYKTTGKDSDTSYYYYEVGSDVSIGLTLVQSGAEDVVITSDESKIIWYSLDSFDNTLVGKQDCLIKIYVSMQTLSGESASYSSIAVWDLSIEAFGFQSAKSVAIKEGARTEYTYGELINGNPDSLDIYISIVYSTGETQDIEPMELRYDSEHIGTQTLMARYLDRWLELEITINDYVSALRPIDDITILWGEEVSFEVYGIYARHGAELLDEGAYSVSGYSNLQIGEQIVTVSYIANPKVTTSFKLVVLDAFKDITLKTAPKTQYSKGDKFDPTSTYTIIMISGATKEVSYNSDDFYYTPELNSTVDKIGEYQRISIYYKGEGVQTPKQVWSGSCLIPNYVSLLEVVLSGSKLEYKYGEELSIVVRATYANGMVTNLDKKSYSTTFNNKVIGKQTVTINYVYSGVNYTAKVEVSVSDTIVNLSITKVPNLVAYGYGDVVNWTGAKVTVTYSAAGQVVYQGDEIKKLNITYSTLLAGSQKVTVESGGLSAFFNITVSKETLACQEKVVEGIKSSLSKRQIAVSEPTTIAQVYASVKVSPYLTAKYHSVTLGMLDPITSGTKKTATGDKLIFVNKDGVEVFVFKIYLNGDTNGDGVIDRTDISGMAGMLADGTAKSEVMDCNGDGKANLTDLVGYARKTGGAPRNVPLTDTARSFITTPTRLKGKEDKYE